MKSLTSGEEKEMIVALSGESAEVYDRRISQQRLKKNDITNLKPIHVILK